MKRILTFTATLACLPCSNPPLVLSPHSSPAKSWPPNRPRQAGATGPDAAPRATDAFRVQARRPAACPRHGQGTDHRHSRHPAQAAPGERAGEAADLRRNHQHAQEHRQAGRGRNARRRRHSDQGPERPGSRAAGPIQRSARQDPRDRGQAFRRAAKLAQAVEDCRAGSAGPSVDSVGDRRAQGLAIVAGASRRQAASNRLWLRSKTSAT